MRETMALLAYAIGAGTLGAVWLRGARWLQAVPRLGVAAWQALSISVLTALLLAGLSLVVPSPVVGGGVVNVLDACLAELQAQFSTPIGALLHGAAALVTLTLGARVMYLGVWGLLVARRARAGHLRSLRLTARRDAGLDALVLDHPLAVAYCLPGRKRTIVLTSAAVDSLDEEELAAVLAHERAHLRGRHHLIMASAAALARAVPRLPALAWAPAEQGRLLEMIADDAAAKGDGRLTVATALVHMAEGAVPAAALGAADVAAADRVCRMLNPAHRPGLARRTLIAAAIGLTVAAPLAIVSSPALVAGQLQYCPPGQLIS